MSAELEEQGCTCDGGYYCRFCRFLDMQDAVREVEQRNSQ